MDARMQSNGGPLRTIGDSPRPLPNATMRNPVMLADSIAVGEQHSHINKIYTKSASCHSYRETMSQVPVAAASRHLAAHGRGAYLALQY